jgi:hypothetical protein
VKRGPKGEKEGESKVALYEEIHEESVPAKL